MESLVGQIVLVSWAGEELLRRLLLFVLESLDSEFTFKGAGGTKAASSTDVRQMTLSLSQVPLGLKRVVL